MISKTEMNITVKTNEFNKNIEDENRRGPTTMHFAQSSAVSKHCIIIRDSKPLNVGPLSPEENSFRQQPNCMRVKRNFFLELNDNITTNEASVTREEDGKCW